MNGTFPVFVVSPGRSGSSTVAKWLIDFGVDMGRRFREADTNNPSGYWEDLDWRDLNDAYLRQKMREQWYVWIAQRLYADRAMSFSAWGVKDPRLCDVMPILRHHVFPMFPAHKQRFIRLYRNHDEMARSMMRCYGLSHEEAMRFIRLRSSRLDESLPAAQTLKIEFADIVNNKARQTIARWL